MKQGDINLLKPQLEKWLIGRPKIIKELARKYPPWNEYVIDKNYKVLGGMIVKIYSYLESGKVKVVLFGIPFASPIKIDIKHIKKYKGDK